MVTPAFYRQEADRCRALALAAKDPVTALRWQRIAKDYETLADSLETAPESPPPTVMHVPMQQQPMQQQQQSKAEPEDKKLVWGIRALLT
jgi:hypothetical protein